MDPILSWVVCLLSAFLLSAGGFLFARAASSRGLTRRVEDVAKLKAALNKLLEERKVRQSRERELKKKLDGAERALAANRELAMDRDRFGGHTELPDPKSYFDRDSAPHMQMVSEDEFEIHDAAPRSVKEAASEAEPTDGLGGHDETRQFNLHSPENIVQFMQRIDELTDENDELQTAISEHEQTIKEKRAASNEQIHRFAALDATATKLRAELKRRNERIRFLEDQLKVQLASDDGPLTDPNAPPRSPSGSELKIRPPRAGQPPPPPRAGQPPPPPPAAFTVGKSALKITGPHDGATLPVRRVSPEELEGDEK